MDIQPTQVLSDEEEEDGDCNLIVTPTLQRKRIHQVASLCVGNKKYPIFEGINTVGRNPTCDVFINDITISKNHAEIEAHAKSAFVCDLRSSNKTRLHNEILRPQRFYQVDDGAQITFGIIKSRYLFLRDIDNSIIIPETPIPIVKIRNSLNNINKLNLNNSSNCENNENSTISLIQTNYNKANEKYDEINKIHVIYNSKKKEKKLKLSDNCNNKSIYDMETQQLNNESVELTKNNYDIQTKNINDFDDIHTVKTQEFVLLKKPEELINNIETNKIVIDGKINKKNHDNINALDNDDNIYTDETQLYSNINNKLSINKNNKSNESTSEINKEIECSNELNSTNKILSQNQITNHIINETDDESETDEEGLFINNEINHENNQKLNNNSNDVVMSESETDEDGEFEALKDKSTTKSYDNDKKNLTSTCSNEHYNRQSPILADLDQLTNKLNTNKINNVNNELSDNDQSLIPTQIIETNHEIKLSINDNSNEIKKSDDNLIIQSKSMKSTKNLLNRTFISDDDMELTQIIKIPIQQENKKITQRNDDYEIIATQIIKNKQEILNNDDNSSYDDDDDIKTQVVDMQSEEKSNNEEKSNDTVIDHNINSTSTPITDKKSKITGNLNDSISENLENLFGEINDDNNLIQSMPMETQQLQDILERTDSDVKKKYKLKMLNTVDKSNSPDFDSQDQYFSKLQTKKKYNVISSSQDNTESDSEINISTSSSSNLIYEPGISGFKSGVAVISDKTIKILKSPVKNYENKSTTKEDVNQTINDGSVPDDQTQKNQEIDILADNWEPFEKKRKEKLAAQKQLNTIKCKSKVHTASTSVESSVKIESSDDEDIKFEDLKKMADNFIADDVKIKQLSVKLKKIPTINHNSSTVDDTIRTKTIDSIDESINKSIKRRTRRNTSNDSISILQDSKFVDEIPPPKRARLRKKINTTSSNSVLESIDEQLYHDKSTEFTDNVKRRTRKIPEKYRDLINSSNQRERQSEVKKIKLNTSILSPTTTSRSRIQHTVLFTGVFGGDYEADVKQCGGTITEVSDNATILVTDKIRRTKKFFCALCRPIPIVSIKWIEDSINAKYFLDSNEYILKDSITESKYKFELRNSLERAGEKKLFDGFTFIITSKVTLPRVEELKCIIQFGGGKALVRPPKLWLKNTIIISCPDDISKVQNLLSKIPKKLEIPVFTTEFILSGILKQELNYNSNRLKLCDNE